MSKTTTNNNWKVLDLRFKDELPKLGKTIYIAHIGNDGTPGPIMKASFSMDILDQFKEGACVWQPVPDAPTLPKRFTLTDIRGCTAPDERKVVCVFNNGNICTRKSTDAECPVMADRMRKMFRSV